MRRAAALNPDWIPQQYFIKQAHSALMGDVTFNPLAV
jgi:hypothetical protein